MCLIKSSTYVAEQSRKLIIRGFILGFITGFATHELLILPHLLRFGPYSGIDRRLFYTNLQKFI